MNKRQIKKEMKKADMFCIADFYVENYAEMKRFYRRMSRKHHIKRIRTWKKAHMKLVQHRLKMHETKEQK